MKAVFAAAWQLNVPFLVGLSEGEREFVGKHHIAAFVRSLREESGFPTYVIARRSRRFGPLVVSSNRNAQYLVDRDHSAVFLNEARSGPPEPVAGAMT